ncbi:Leucyl-tRNA synthetase, putative [Perkinsus marinus ATCC 50983]|uniref:leucine--tRNA ligase n=1 Tax=Perkinsus marinus (strain ATCC 50983 / TXsc) TaxID=423536 RepID=C5KBE7_PERM5|nr:Leucyl-tRNA synthetase, putative [Perkinsus marinus ATCC 50983]EER18473.1 Leucyl-tRNA synthetase, putative [Perkinsus marinus ATCC 50983]|eukprot:XP_002786677.1 Leucyl-tRNA synthetase, putative [Perkinsus marinus ATCC 50983]
MATAENQTGNFTRRDKLVEYELTAQKKWEDAHVYERNAPEEGDGPEHFMVTFAIPYMNGMLHLGHAFSLTKAEFAVRYQSLKGKNALFPFGFHCTGMPIQAAAGNLKRELAHALESEDEASDPESSEQGQQTSSESAAASLERKAVGIFHSKKSKTKAKTGGLSQIEILKSMGIPDEEIPKFCEPQHWLEYFPPLGQRDLKRFGVAVDWRRSFITTDANPFFDAFVQWQFRHLKAGNRLAFGNRPTIYSIRDGQPCADHDRASGEGVNPQEYTLIKMGVQEVKPEWNTGDNKVFFVAATLRPETMYGQTNCFVLPTAQYGIFQMNNGEAFICSYRSALNMVMQELGPKTKNEDGEDCPVQLATVKGSDLLGTPLSAPLAKYSTVYALPLLTISMGKGTGIVTSVPADAPDDYAALKDWKTRQNWRDQYGVKEEWCVPFEVVPIIRIEDMPEWGDEAAVYLCESMKIDSHKQKDKLTEAKKLCYNKGFYQGKMIIGPYAGKTVQEAKPLVRKDLIDAGLAIKYYEPEGLVVSRSGDECVVAYCDQWYIRYGEEEWKNKVLDHVQNHFETFNPSSLNQQISAIEWLKNWACSRNFGLGTRLPWDKRWIIESLSDSTIYMAYYTIAHLLQGGVLDGSGEHPLGIDAEQMTDAVFDYIFDLADEPPADSAISRESLDKLKREFNYWYPMSLRCSGKDLIPNHLTMCLYSHAAIWEDRPDLWPEAFFTNGHVMVDDEKMSKSRGNFLTLDQACGEFSADATRLALADAGDGLENANFKRKTANDSILALTTFDNWATEVTTSPIELAKERDGEYTFVDKCFANELNRLIKEADAGYSKMMMRDALKAGWFDMQNLRDQYRVLTDGSMHRDLLRRYIEVQALVMVPITPHFCEHIWSDILHKEGLAVQQLWPEVDAPFDESLGRQYNMLQSNLREFRLELQKHMQPKKKGPAPVAPTDAVIYVTKEYKPFQQTCLKVLSEVELDENNEPVDKKFMGNFFKDHPLIKVLSKQEKGMAMKFAPFHMQTEVRTKGKAALALTLPFDETRMIEDQKGLIKKQLGLPGEVEVRDAAEDSAIDKNNRRATGAPGRAVIVFYAKDSTE